MEVRLSDKRIRVKMCGMKKAVDIQLAADLGVDAVGLIFSAESSRAISLFEAKSVLAHRPLFLNIVAVVVNPTEQDVCNLLEELPIHYLQFHGEESAEFCRQFGIPYMKSVPVRSEEFVLEAMDVYQDAAALVLDTHALQTRGGSGKSFDWTMVPKYRRQPLILAGGLSASNVVDAINCVQPDAVDVSSGIELSPGIKDFSKMKAFVNAVRGS